MTSFCSTLRRGVVVLLLLVFAAVPARSQSPDVDAWGQVGRTLQALHASFGAHVATGKAARSFSGDAFGLRVYRGRVAVEVVTEAGEAPRVARELNALGITDASRRERLVTGRLPIGRLPEVAGLAGVHSVYPVLARTHVGAVTSRGVPVMETGALRSRLDSDGAGVTVGVLSNSFDNYDNSQPGSATAADDIASGDLPPRNRINVLRDAAEPASDEGRAMMQIVYDVAPGVDFAFHTADGGRAAFADAIRALSDAGAGVIVDDILYLNEPAYQDGLVTRAIDDVVRRNDATYVTSAGNSGRRAYEAPFRGSGMSGALGGELHDFDPGPGLDTVQRIRIENGSRFQVAFHWDQPYASTGGPGAVTDLEIYLVDKRGSILTALQPEQRNNIGGDPFEFISYSEIVVDADGDGQQDTEYGLVIERKAGPSPTRIRYVPFERAGSVEVEEYAVNAPALYGHPNAASAITTAAAAWFDTPSANPDLDRPLVHTFSSVGGTPVLFDNLGQPIPPVVRAKPDVTAPDGTNTTFFGQELDDGDDFPNFFGTSAAAPHVAGLAAIVRAAIPDASAGAVKTALIESAADIRETRDDADTAILGEDAAGFDFFSGTGLVQGDALELSPLAAGRLRAVAERPAPGGRIRVTWQERASADVAAYRLQQSYAGGAFEVVAEQSGRGEGTYEETLDDLRAGRHTFRLSWTTGSGQEVVGPETEATVTVDRQIVVTRKPFPNPARTSAQLELTAQQTQNVLLALYDVTGRYLGIVHVGTLRAGEPSRIRLNGLDRFASGQHFIRVIGDTFDEAVPLTLIR